MVRATEFANVVIMHGVALGPFYFETNFEVIKVNIFVIYLNN